MECDVLLTAGTNQYRFVVDGEWRDDPEYKIRVQNPFGTQNDVIEVATPPDQDKSPR